MPISAQLLNELFTCIQLVGRAYHRNDAASAIHHGQGKLLHILLTHDGCSQRELCGLLQIRPASLSELLDKLERSGAVERRQSPDDRRVSCVYLTDLGRERAALAAVHRKKEAQMLAACLTEAEQEQLIGLLQKVEDGLKRQLEGEGPPPAGRE